MDYSGLYVGEILNSDGFSAKFEINVTNSTITRLQPFGTPVGLSLPMLSNIQINQQSERFEKTQGTYSYIGRFVTLDRIEGTWNCTKNGNQSTGTFWAAK